ncbi:MAG: PAS domain S-box protein [Archaeoglobaceae archaeon]|nr:PAS domain S-box protein [Archaeoglobaceae archaeon]MDW8128065.1 PAS domain S-box protein [Archaeoglobaceae archaeon]
MLNFQRLLESLPLAIIITDGRSVLYKNKHAEEIGLKPELREEKLFIGDHIYKLFKGKFEEYEIILAMDYTQEQRNIEVLRVYEKFFKEGKDFFFILDEKGRFIEVNPTYEIMGYKREELLGKTSRVLAFEDQIEILRENFRKVMSGETVRFVFKARNTKGELRFIEVTEWPRIVNGRVVGSEGVARDVTERAMLQEELERTNRAMQILTQINQQVFREKDEYSLLQKVCGILKSFGIRAFAWLYEGGKFVEATPFAFECIIRDRIEFKYETCKCERAKGKTLTLPMTYEGKVLGVIAFCSIGDLTENELKVFSQLSEDLGFAIAHYKAERERKIMSNLLIENLKQFENLSDKLRNPLGIAMGYVEIANEIGTEKAIKEIEKQLRRIIETIEEMRFQEILTFLLTKREK